MTDNNSTRQPIDWQDHITQWQSSGLSQAAYCRAHSLAESQFSYYKYKFAEPTIRPQHKASTGFVSVQLADELTPQIKPAQALTLHFTNGAHLSGITADNIAIVQQLARALA